MNLFPQIYISKECGLLMTALENLGFTIRSHMERSPHLVRNLPA